MSFLERAKQAAESARQAASDAAEQARHVATDAATHARQTTGEVAGQARQVATGAATQAQATMRDPLTRQRARETIGLARRGLSTAVERIDPSILADVIMKATLLQEKANAALRRKGSNYRIGTVSIGASIPPSISFAIVRVGDPKAPGSTELQPDDEVDEGEHLVPHPIGDEVITTLDGSQLTDTDLAALADASPADGAAGEPPLS